MINGRTCFGVIVGNRGFFPDELARAGHEYFSRLLARLGYASVILGETDTKCGSVETWQEAKKCAGLFAEHRGEIDGIIATLPNFGDERGIADTVKLAGLDVPVLVHAWQDDPARMDLQNRRDSFCGKMSACNNFVQYNIPFSLTALHTMDPAQPAFEQELHWFAAVCRVVGGLRRCRVGALGARPAAFNTVRFSEKLLEESGISVETLDLSDAFGRSDALDPKSAEVKDHLAKMRAYTKTGGVPETALLAMAKLGIVIDRWMAESELDTIAVQCWTAMEEYFGLVPCTVMSMLSESLRSAACEVDVCGAVAMHALRLAGQRPSYLLDWNNNY
ncbi:MAG TPA: fucose isomerase, partial [Candidatus Bathyarchaeia archaeon]|nr:fucose isomerase [Candidatus Bathyarchaeia archaeon]